MKSNFFLMLKQGFKGVFKYKIQFIIILVLCFLSTFMVTSTLSIRDRINSTYNNVVKNVEPFDYTATLQTYQDSISLPNNGTYILGTDMQNDAYSSYDNELQTMTEYNFDILANNSYWKQTIISNEFKGYWTNIINEEEPSLGGWGWNLNQLENFWFDFDKNSWSTIKSIDLLTINTFSAFNNVDVQNNNSLFSEFYLSNQTFKSWVDQVNLDLSQKETLEEKIKVISDDSQTQDQKNWSYHIFSTSAWLMRALLLNVYDYKEYLNETIGSAAITVKDTFEFLFGQKFDNTASSITKWTDGSILGSKYDSKSNIKDFATIENSKIKSHVNEKNALFSALAKTGLKGQLNPIVIYVNDKDIVGSKNLLISQRNICLEERNIFEELNFFRTINVDDSNTSASLEFLLKWNTNNLQNGNTRNRNFITIPYFDHLKIAASIANFDLYIRREIIVSDPITTIQYRGVVLDNENKNNFTILKGRAPIGHNEIDISEQFAKKNKIELGAQVNIGNARFKIVGFATDAYSYYPTSDPDMPIPQPTVSALIYGSAATIGNLAAPLDGNRGDDSATYNFNLFLTNKNKENIKALNQQANKFMTYQFNSKEDLYKNQQAINNNFSTGNVVSFFGLTDFSSSNYHFSWTLQPMTMNAFSILLITFSSIIGTVALISLIICIKKTIQFNSKQIAILKAMGEKPSMIALSYITYSLLITFIAVPIAWFVGNLTEMPLSAMFSSYFSIKPNVLLFDWASLAISFVLIGVVGAIIAYLFAFMITNQSVMKILKNSTKWSNSKFVHWLNKKPFKNKKFSLRFSLNLASSGKRTIGLMVLVTSIATFLTAIGLMIPATAIYAKNIYYKSIKYANQYNYDNLAPVANTPLAKTAINYWEGQKPLEENWVDDKLNLDGTGKGFGFYQNPDNYSASIDGSSPIPKYMYSSGGAIDVSSLDYSYLKLLRGDDEQGLIGNISDVFGNNFSESLGVGFTIGMIDKWFGLILNSLDSQDLLGPNGTNYSNWTDEEKISFSSQFSGFLTTSIPPIITAVLGGSGDVSDATNWKQQIIGVLGDSVPAYVKTFMSNDSRYEQFKIGWNNDSYVPNEETFTTTTKLSSKKINNLNLQGIDKPQVAYEIGDKDYNKVFLDQSTVDQLEAIIDGTIVEPKDIIFNGFKLYDATSKELNIPTIFNKQAETGYGSSVNTKLTNFTTSNQQMINYKKLNHETGKYDYTVLPKYAWGYDDFDFVNSDYYQKNDLGNKVDLSQATGAKKFNDSLTSNGTSRWLDLYALDNTKISLKTMYDDQNNLVDNAFLFDDFTADNENNPLKTYIRPYYEYNNVKMFIPLSDITANENTLTEKELAAYFDKTWQDNVKATDKKVLDNDYNSTKASKWYDVVEADDVPTIIKNSFGDQKSHYIAVKAYDADDYTKTPSSSMQKLTSNDIFGWFHKNGRTDKDNPPLKIIETKSSINNVDKINIVEKATLNSYNSKVVLSDIRISNILQGYSNYVSYGNNASLFDKTNLDNVQAGVRDQNGIISKFDRYKLKDKSLVSDASNATYLSDSTQAANQATQIWHNGKLSNIVEPISLTSGISFAINKNVGEMRTGSGAFSDNSTMMNMVASKTLLETTKTLVNQIVTLAISIGSFLIAGVIVTATLFIMIIGDIYISQYKRFMILMRSLGYGKAIIRIYAFGAVSVLSLIMWAGMTIFAYSMIYIGITIISHFGFALPFSLVWWPPVLSFVVIFGSFFGSLLISSRKLSKESPATLMSETSE